MSKINFWRDFMSYLLVEQNKWNEFYMVQFIKDLNIWPDEDGFSIIYSAYNDLFQLTELQDRKTRKKIRSKSDGNEGKQYGIGISRIVDSVVEIIFAEMKKGKDESIEQYNKIFDKEGKGLFEEVEGILKGSENVPTRVRKLKANYRKYIERQRKDLKELFELPDQHGKLYNSNLYKHIFAFGEIYFLIGYCLKKNKDKFFELVNVSEKKDQFLQHYSSVGKKFIDNMGVLMGEQRGIEQKAKLTQSATKQKLTNHTQLGEVVSIDAELDDVGQALDKFTDDQLHKPYLKLNLPEVTKYKMVSAYDILGELILNVPIETSDTLDIQDVEVHLEQKYLFSLTNPIGLCLIDDLVDEGTIDGVVIVRDIFNTYHIFIVKEDEGFSSEVEYETIEGEEQFLQYYSDLINQYELPQEENSESGNNEDVYLSTVTDVLKALDKLTQ